MNPEQKMNDLYFFIYIHIPDHVDGIRPERNTEFEGKEFPDQLHAGHDRQTTALKPGKTIIAGCVVIIKLQVFPCFGIPEGFALQEDEPGLV
jgi:hypothetical protein